MLVLYDDILNERVGNLTKSVVGLTPRNDPLIYRDINRRALTLPNMVFPYRRAIVYLAKTACDYALNSSRAHSCLDDLDLSPERWQNIIHQVATVSEGFGNTDLAGSVNSE